MGAFTAEDREKIGRYHTGGHEGCVSCRMVLHIDVQAARITELEAALRETLTAMKTTLSAGSGSGAFGRHMIPMAKHWKLIGGSDDMKRTALEKS